MNSKYRNVLISMVPSASNRTTEEQQVDSLNDALRYLDMYEIIPLMSFITQDMNGIVLCIESSIALDSDEMKLLAASIDAIIDGHGMTVDNVYALMSFPDEDVLFRRLLMSALSPTMVTEDVFASLI